MNSNVVSDPNAIDASMTGFLTAGIGESALKTDTQARIRRSQERRNVSEHMDTFGGAMIEMLESRSLPSGTTIDELDAEVTNLHQQIADVDTQIAEIPTGTKLNWKASTVAGWDGELPSTNGKYLCNSAVTASGKYLVEGYNDGTIEIRNAESGAIEKTMKTGIGRAYFLVEDPTRDVVYVSAGESSGAVIAIDTVSGTELWRKATGGWTNAASVSPDGSKVMVDVDGKGVQILDALSGLSLGTTNANDYAGTALAGGKIATIRDWASVWIREANGSEKQVLSMSGLAYKVAVAPSGTKIAVAGAGGSIGLFDTATGKATQWTGEGTKIWSLTFSNDGTLVTAHRGGTVEFWNVSGTSPVLQKSLFAGTDIVDEMYVQKENLIIQTRDAAPLLRTMKVENPEFALQRASLLTQRSELQARLLTVQTDLATAQEKTIEDAKVAADAAAALALKEATNSALNITPAETVSTINTETLTMIAEALVTQATKQERQELSWNPSTVSGWDGELSSGRSSRLNNSAMTVSGTSLVMVYNDGTIEIRDAANGDIKSSMNTGIGRGYFVVEDPTREVVYVSAGESSGAVIAIDTTTGTELWRKPTGGWTNAASISPDGTKVMVDVDGKGVQILDTLSGQSLGATNGNDYAGTALADGKIATIRDWSSVWIREANGTEKQVLSMSGLAYKVAVAPSGTTIAVAGAGGVISLYDLSSGQETRMNGEQTKITELTFIGSGALAVAHVGGTVEVWNVSAPVPYIANCLAAGRDIVDEMYEAGGSLVMQTRENIPVLRTLKMPDVLPSDPLLEAVNIQGVNITIAASSPLEGENTVMFEGAPQEGFFTRATIEGSSNGNLSPVSITLNPTNPTGQYRVVLKSPNGTILSAFPVCWDADQKKLSLGSGTELWTSGGAQGKAMNQQSQELLAMSQNPTIVGGSLGQMQQSVLIGTLPTLGAPYCNWAPTFQTAFFKAHPEWRDEVMHDTAMKTWENRVGNYTVTQIYTQMMRDRTDLMSSLGAAYSQYYSMLSDLLQRGLSTLSDIRNGGNDTRLRSDFSLVVSSYAGSIPMSQLSSIGISMPNADLILRTVQKIWNKNCEQLIQTKTAEAQIAAQKEYRAQVLSSGNFVEASDGTLVLKTDPRASTELVYYTDPQKRLTLLPQGVAEKTNTSATNTLVADIFNTQTELSKQHLYLLLGIGKELTDPLPLTVQPGKSGLIDFHIDEEKMVSFGVPGQDGRNLTLQISGTGLGTKTYPSNKTGNSGESVSLRLPAGDYKLVVEDSTDYTNFYSSPFANQSFPVNVETNIKPYNSAKIEGLMTIEGNKKVMPVSMSVAEFDAVSGKRLETPSHGLDPNKPVCVVIHGRKDKPDSNNMKYLTQELTEFAENNSQVVTIDWNEAANDIARILGIDIGDLDDASWTPAVGAWVGQQLLNAGFQTSKISFVAPSHGSFAAFFAAEWIKNNSQNHEKVASIVALDSAKNPVFFGANIPEEHIVFKDVAVDSLVIHSSILGSKNRAFGAEKAITVTSPSIDPFMEHGFAVSLFADILDDIKNGRNQGVVSHFSRSADGSLSVTSLPNVDGYDAWIEVRANKESTPDGDWWKAQATTLRLRNPDGSWEDPIVDPEALTVLPSNPQTGPGTYIA